MKTAAAFEFPDVTQVANLVVARLGETTLKPDSPVFCLNRGRKPLSFTFDGNHIDLPAGGFDEDGQVLGYFRTEYGAAQHAQRHLIVKGTRDLEIGGYQSWIAILGSDDGRVSVDPAENCKPFTDEELTTFGEPLEGLSPAGRDPLVAIRTSAGRAMSRHQGVGTSLRPQIGVNEQASEAAREASAHVFDPPAESLTRQAEADAAAEPRAADEAPQPRPMKRR